MRNSGNRNYETLSDKSAEVNGAPAWIGLHPVSIVTHGTPAQPVEALMGVQSGLYRLIVALERIGLPRVVPAFRSFFNARTAKPAQNSVLGYGVRERWEEI